MYGFFSVAVPPQPFEVFSLTDDLGEPTGEPDTEGPDPDVVDDNPPPVKTDRVEDMDA